MAGRPTVRTPELVEELCEHIAHGGSVVEWCAQEGRPGYTTIMRWRDEDEEFRENYTRAQEDQGDYFAEKVTITADSCIADTVEIAKAKLQIDSYKWAAGIRKPKAYGAKSAIDLTSGGKTIESLTDDERTARLAALLDKAGERRARQASEE
jgi:hypothetical protein